MFVKKTKTTKPSTFTAVDFSHPLTRGLKAAYLMNDNVFSSTRKFNAAKSAVMNTLIHPEHGKGLDFEASQYVDMGQVIGQDTPITYFVIASADDLASTNNDICVGYGDRATLRQEATGGDAVFFTWSSGGGWQDTRQTGLSAGVASTIIATHDGSTNRVFVNGNYTETSVSQRGSSGNIDHDLYIGSDDETSGRLLNGKVYLCYIWERALTINEALALTANPYQILMKQNQYLFVAAVGGGGEVPILRRRIEARAA